MKEFTPTPNRLITSERPSDGRKRIITILFTIFAVALLTFLAVKPPVAISSDMNYLGSGTYEVTYEITAKNVLNEGVAHISILENGITVFDEEVTLPELSSGDTYEFIVSFSAPGISQFDDHSKFSFDKGSVKLSEQYTIDPAAL